MKYGNFQIFSSASCLAFSLFLQALWCIVKLGWLSFDAKTRVFRGNVHLEYHWLLIIWRHLHLGKIQQFPKIQCTGSMAKSHLLSTWNRLVGKQIYDIVHWLHFQVKKSGKMYIRVGKCQIFGKICDFWHDDVIIYSNQSDSCTIFDQHLLLGSVKVTSPPHNEEKNYF